MASFSLFDLENIVGAETAEDFAGGPFGGKSMAGAIPGLITFGDTMRGALVGLLRLR